MEISGYMLETLKHKRAYRFLKAVARGALGITAITLLTFVCFRLRLNLATAECLYLVIIVLISLWGNLLSSVVASVIAVGCLAYYFSAPMFSFQVDDPFDGVSIVALLITSTVITTLVSRVRKFAEELRYREMYLKEFQRLSRTGSFGWRVATGEILWSEESFRIFQYDRTMKPSLEHVLQRVHPEDAALVKQIMVRVAQDGKDFDFETRLLMPDGSASYVHIVAHAASNEPGNIEFVGAVMDVTERKQAEEELRNVQADLAHVARVTTLGELTASIAHEVNQPLAAVVTNGNACLRWLAAQPPNLEEARTAVGRIVKDGHRASEVVGRIRALVKKAPPQKEWLDVNAILREVTALARSEAHRYQVSLQTQFSEDLPPVYGDRVQLQQVILNLMINGIEAMSSVNDGTRELVVHSSVVHSSVVHSSKEGVNNEGANNEEANNEEANKKGANEVLVKVCDQGIGLDPENAGHLFDTFYTTKPTGLGMGLAISRSIIEAHNGRLWAEPNVAQGAVFQFSLPAGEERVS